MITEIQSKKYKKSRSSEAKQAMVAEATRSVYLVVNMATWADKPVDTAFLNQVAASLPPADLIATVYPESVLPHARRYAARCDTVINLDRHAGLAGGEELLFEDGQEDFRRFELSSETWGDYTDFEKKEAFIWAHPEEDCHICPECRADIYNDPEDLPFERITQRLDGSWRRLAHYVAKPPAYGVVRGQVRAAAFVLSPGRCSPSAVIPFLAFVKSHGLSILDWSPGYLHRRWFLAECDRR